MEEHVEISMLLDCYGPLLTEKQLDIMTLYYSDNLSLAEIAEIANTSRQAIHDLLKRCHKTLVDYESKLKLKEIAAKRSAAKKELKENLDKIKEQHLDLTEKIVTIEKLIDDI